MIDTPLHYERDPLCSAYGYTICHSLGLFKFEISFEWHTTRLCSGAYILISRNVPEEAATSKIVTFADVSKLVCTIKTVREIVRKFKTRELQYLGHLIRPNTSQIQLIEGKKEGRRSRGRPRNTWTTDITTTNGMKYYQLKRAAEDRKRWHGLVDNLAQETTLQ